MALDKKRIQVLCFDVDGTLRDTDDEIVDQLAKWLKPIRFMLRKKDPRLVARRLVMGLETPANYFFQIKDWLTIDDEMVKFNSWLQKKQGLKPKNKFLIIPGIDTSLEQLSPHFPMTVISARDEDGTMVFLDQVKFTRLFKCIATGQTTPHTKPWPDPIYWVAEQLGTSPENCLMIGDTTVDIRSGCAAGAQTVGVLSGFGHEKELVKAGADLILESVADLPEVLLA
jgi:HAD superfamily hydrolase (TIGR01549 family)